MPSRNNPASSNPGELNPAAILTSLPQLPAGAQFVLAYSGGLDSTVLLHLLKDRVPLRAVHVHHGLQEQADDWARHCSAQCAAWQVPCVVHKVKVPATSISAQGLEAAARNARYAALASALHSGDVLLTAQHADDQAETVMLQLLRGAGPKGLAGMPASRPFADTWLLRPLLSVRRKQLHAWACAQALNWMEDPSNHDPALERSWLRRTLWPLLQVKRPDLVGALTRVAQLQADALELQDSLGQIDLPACQRDAHSLSCHALLGLTSARRRNVLRHWLQCQGAGMPSAVKLQRGLDALLNARVDAQPQLCWGLWQLRRHGDGLYLLPADLGIPERFDCPWQPDTPLALPGGRLSARATAGGLRHHAQPFQLRQRSGGERLLVRGTHRQVKDLLREAGIPPWLRGSVPLVYADAELVAIAGLHVADNWRVDAASASGWQLDWQPRLPGWPE